MASTTVHFNKGHSKLNGKVASIINERELAINIGATNGVLVGMKFKILANMPIDIVDPETNESLGQFDREKVRVEAVDIYPKYSVCRTYKIIASDSSYGSAQSIIAAFYGSRSRNETLRADKENKIPPLSEEESYIKIGDRVIEIDPENDKD